MTYMDLLKWVSFPESIVFKDPEPLCEGSNHKFLQSAKAGDYDTFERLLRQCPDLDVNFVEDPRCPQQDFSVACGRTPLWWAVDNNNVRMVR